MLKVACLVAATACLSLHTAAQPEYLKAAHDHYAAGDYYGAAQLYEKWLAGPNASKAAYNPYINNKAQAQATASTTDKTNAQWRLADSYYRLHQYAKAQPVYKALADGGNQDAAFYHATCLKYEGQAAAATDAFNAYLALQPTNAELAEAARREMESLRFAGMQAARRDLMRFKAEPQAAYNSTGATYAPASIGGKLVFTSTRPDETYSKKNPNANKLYMVVDEKGPQLLALPADDAMEHGIASFSADGNTMYLTKWQMAGGRKVAAIYVSRRNASGWDMPQKLGPTVNAEGASTAQPFVMADGTMLLFSSDRPGGQGGNDLWVISLNAAGQPQGEARNLATVNSKGNDEAPFYHIASKTLVFSTNGRTGMGGYDLFYAKGHPAGNFAAPVNLGIPANSVKDELYYLGTDGKTIWSNALFSSDRASECCLELFSFNKARVKKTISGVVRDCKTGAPLPGARITARAPDGKVLFDGQTGNNGTYSFVLDDLTNISATATAAEFNPASANTTAPADDDMDVESMTLADLCLQPIERPVEVNKSIVLENVLFDFNKATLSKASYPVFDTLITWMNQYPGMVIELSSHTDNIGSDAYNKTLSEKRAASCVDYLLSKGIARDRMVAKGYGETMPVAPNQIYGKDNPEGRKKNRRTEFKVLKY